MYIVFVFFQHCLFHYSQCISNPVLSGKHWLVSLQYIPCTFAWCFLTKSSTSFRCPSLNLIGSPPNGGWWQRHLRPNAMLPLKVEESHVQQCSLIFFQNLILLNIQILLNFNIRGRPSNLSNQFSVFLIMTNS